jgi:hypothetical protein
MEFRNSTLDVMRETHGLELGRPQVQSSRNWA